VEVTLGSGGDAHLLEPIVGEAAKHFSIAEVSADKAYSTYANHDFLAALGATPYIAFKENATAEQGGMMEKMFHVFSLHREDFLCRYHRRSNVESAFSALKRKFGGFLRSRTTQAMFNEALAKVIVYNLSCVVHAIHEMGIDPTFWIGGAKG